ncbi:tyrosine-type recombinase/integrase [Peristeroidobacter soli]|jgi:integrase/recombinase XerD|uniref:tyrosine-type recombinase/integrase n=1 Tax=Peristeroidobacter soli TaxID=2497877 RepID=UPI00101CD4D4|nr:site-specific integrase [Peristeroidobacter soli]
MNIDPWLGQSDDLVRRFTDVLLVENRYSIYTCADYRADLRGLDRWLQQFEGCTLASASDQQLHRYLSEWVSSRATARKVPRVLLSLRRFYSFLCDSHARDDNPMLHQSIAHWDEQRRPRATTIRRQRESARAVAARDRAMLALMISGGLRAAQLISLRLSDLHLEQGSLSVRGRRLVHSVSLSDTLVAMLKEFLVDPREVLLQGRDCVHVFPSCGGRALTGRAFWDAFRRRAEACRTLVTYREAPARNAFVSNLSGARLRIEPGKISTSKCFSTGMEPS